MLYDISAKESRIFLLQFVILFDVYYVYSMESDLSIFAQNSYKALVSKRHSK